jgi:hypothetical protein
MPQDPNTGRRLGAAGRVPGRGSAENEGARCHGTTRSNAGPVARGDRPRSGEATSRLREGLPRRALVSRETTRPSARHRGAPWPPHANESPGSRASPRTGAPGVKPVGPSAQILATRKEPTVAFARPERPSPGKARVRASTVCQRWLRRPPLPRATQAESGASAQPTQKSSSTATREGTPRQRVRGSR